jgi:hypothetical protein
MRNSLRRAWLRGGFAKFGDLAVGFGGLNRKFAESFAETAQVVDSKQAPLLPQTAQEF